MLIGALSPSALDWEGPPPGIKVTQSRESPTLMDGNPSEQPNGRTGSEEVSRLTNACIFLTCCRSKLNFSLRVFMK
jgi:hypothetical protein